MQACSPGFFKCPLVTCLGKFKKKNGIFWCEKLVVESRVIPEENFQEVGSEKCQSSLPVWLYMLIVGSEDFHSSFLYLMLIDWRLLQCWNCLNQDQLQLPLASVLHQSQRGPPCLPVCSNTHLLSQLNNPSLPSTVYNEHTEFLGHCGFSIWKKSSLPTSNIPLCLWVFCLHSLSIPVRFIHTVDCMWHLGLRL